MDRLRSLIRDVPDFPSPGILFRDITPLLADAGALREAVDRLTAPYREEGVDVVAGIESRGFLFATPLAIALGAGCVPIRKMGKLPAPTLGRKYSLEYGSNHLEMHMDAVTAGQRVLLVDDVLATGGTAAASVQMIRELGGELVGASFLIELEDLDGRRRLEGVEVRSLLRF